ncbi:MAG: bifunctional UDP-N-acetylglucosamine diphosphorylase/glucosamine-1-phosphate N-acetyltransferase GlmU [Actinomycetota bacterium]
MAARTPPRKLAAVLLAAGEGKRMKSDRPKVLHDVCGRPSLWHVAKAAIAARPATLAVVVSQGSERVEEAVRSWGLRPEPAFVHQGEPLGTGHAVAASEGTIGDAEDVLVLAGDDPLVTEDHVRSLLKVHRRTRAAGTILTTVLDDPSGFGRVIREGDQLVEIVQESDASPHQRRIREVSTLVYVFRREDLFGALPLVSRENRQREYYLPDVIHILLEKGETVSAVAADFGGALGLNSRGGLAAVTHIVRRRIVERHMANGVTFLDPATAYVDVDVRIGPDTVVHPLTFLQGNTRIGTRCSIGPATRITDSRIDDESEVTFSVVRESRIGGRSAIGPYAHLRPGTVLAEGAKAGSFVEIKASRVGKGSKVPHLSYVGDATIGEGANIGAGTVTVNYDGYEKHPTVIGDRAFIGSDTMLIAPVKVGKEASTGAGSVITRDVPAGALAVERAEQRTVAGYAERKRAARARGGKGRVKQDDTKGRRGRG